MEAVFFLWLAGIIDNLGGALVGLIAVMSALVCITLLWSVLTMGDSHHDSASYKKAQDAKVKALKFAFKVIFPLVIFTALIPSQKTMYIMAGGYFGQAALQSETAGKVLKIVNQQLDDTLAGMIEKKSK